MFPQKTKEKKNWVGGKVSAVGLCNFSSRVQFCFLFRFLQDGSSGCCSAVNSRRTVLLSILVSGPSSVEFSGRPSGGVSNRGCFPIWTRPSGFILVLSLRDFPNFFRVHAKGVVLCERTCFCLLSTF